MTDQLLPYYQRELAFIRRMGAEFAEKHPEVAGALRLGADSSEDPHVERMIMAFAYLTARIRHKLDDDFPELTTALLGVLYPHYLAPIPSMAVVEFQLDRAQSGLTAGYRIDRHRSIETEPIGGEPCRFRTVYPVTLWPLEAVSARLSALAPSTPHAPPDAVAALRLELGSFSKEVPLSKMQPGGLRFFLNGQAQHVFALYELLLNDVIDVTVGAPRDPDPVHLGRDAVLPVGFSEEEGILPCPERSFPGYRLLSEYFAFPLKFCFLDLSGLDARVMGRLGSTAEICFWLGRTSQDLERNVGRETFRLGCTPIVNLFSQRAEPIQLLHTDSEYRVVPDARRHQALEVYSIDRVDATSPAGEEVEYRPFYSLGHAASAAPLRAFWHGVRRPSSRALSEADHGTEMYISLVDLDAEALLRPDWTLQVETTCFNRDLPQRIPFGGGQPVLQLADGGPFSRIVCLTPPTGTLRPPAKKGALWRIISHLTLNHLSIAGKDRSPDALREILRLYDFTDSPEMAAKIAGILSVDGRPSVGRLRSEGCGEFCRGVEVEIQFDEERFSDGSLFLFASVLDRFLGLYASINSFSRLVAVTKQRKGILKRWPPRSAQRILL